MTDVAEGAQKRENVGQERERENEQFQGVLAFELNPRAYKMILATQDFIAYRKEEARKVI